MLQRVIFDCNVFLQALVNKHGASGECLNRARNGHLAAVTCQQILEEIRIVTAHPRLLRRFPSITGVRVEQFMNDLADFMIIAPNPPERIVLSRDPTDSVYLNLAIAFAPCSVVTNDNDLLTCMEPASEHFSILGKNSVTILKPSEFLQGPP